MLLNEPVERFISHNIVDPEGIINQLSLSLFCSGEECERNTSSLQSHEGRSRGATQITTTPLSSPQFQKLKIIQVWCGVVWCGVVWCGVVRGGDSD